MQTFAAVHLFWDALTQAFLHSRATGAEVGGQSHQASTIPLLRRESLAVHEGFYLPRADLELPKRLVQAAAGEVLVEQAVDVGVDGFVKVDIAPFLHQPLGRGCQILPHPTRETCRP